MIRISSELIQYRVYTVPRGLHRYSTQGFTQYTGVCIVHRGLHSTHGFTQYIGVYTVHRGLQSTHGFTQYTGVYTVHSGLHSSQGFTQYTGVYTVHRGLHSTQGLTQYTEIYIVHKGLHTGSPKKHETWKTTWELLMGILIRMKALKLKQICEKLVRCLLFLVKYLSEA